MSAVAGRLYVYGTLTKLPNTNVQLTMYGNLIVDRGGVVDFSLADGSTWFVQFMVASERQFVGGGDVPLDLDVGWWVTGAGRVNLQGSPKTAWTRLAQPALAGQTQITVQDATGWRVGDEITIVPNEPPTVSGWYDHFDVASITRLNGTAVTLSGPLRYPHPTPASPTMTNGRLQTVSYPAEVLNLTRTGRIEGRAGFRTHFWIHNTSQPTQPQGIRFVQFRYLGPQSFDRSGNLTGVVGRWGGPHFHMNGNLSNGSLVEGAVVRDFGNHAFVPHDSNGITLRSNVAFDGFNDAVWWDTGIDPTTGMMLVGPNHLTLFANVAARVQFIPSYRGVRLTGFFLGPGDQCGAPCTSNVVEYNVAVGVQGTVNSSGFLWPEVPRLPQGTWRFDVGNISHNNAVNGIFSWQNDSLNHQIVNFVAYYNTRGIEHGAYGNDYLYQDVTLFGNAQTGFLNLAMSRDAPPNPGLRLSRLYIDAFGRPYGLMTGIHLGSGRQPVHIQNSTFVNYTVAGIGLTTPGPGAEWFDVSSTSFSGNRYWLLSTLPAGSLLIDYDQGWYVRRRDQPGAPMPQWNASVTAVSQPR